MPKLSLVERSKVFAWKQVGKGTGWMARQLGVNRCTIQRLLAKKEKVGEEQAAKDSPRSGRPKKKTPGNLELLLKLCTENPFASCKELKVMARGRLEHLSIRSMQRMLHDAGFPAR